MCQQDLYQCDVSFCYYCFDMFSIVVRIDQCCQLGLFVLDKRIVLCECGNWNNMIVYDVFFVISVLWDWY